MSPDSNTEHRARKGFLSALHAGELPDAITAAQILVAGNNSRPSHFSFIRKALTKITPETLPLKPLKVALLSSFSIEFLHDPLVSLAFLEGLRTDIYQAGFGQFRQQILNPQSRLYAFSPDVVILAVEGRDWIPAVYRDYLDLMDGKVEKDLSAFRQEISNLIGIFRECSEATLLIHSLVPPIWRQLGILDGHVNQGQAELLHESNKFLYSVCRDTPGAFVVDYAGLVGRFGTQQWYDERLHHYARLPIAQPMLPHLAREYIKFFRGLTGKTKKCLVVDLDNTLWGGVVGEDGVHGIQLGPDYPGSAYAAFQEAILNLHKRGIILAIASKNNPADVDEVFANHPYMILQKAHFAQEQIHWGVKSHSLVEIARRLNIALEHMVFVDDNPVECHEIASTLPMVTVIRLPQQPEHFVSALLEGGLFDGLSFSQEDRNRADLYRQVEQAERLRGGCASIDDFYRELEMEVIFSPVQAASVKRAAQLTQKTNQFNVTTIRYSDSEIAGRAKDREWLVTTVRVKDRFGDNGIVGLMMARLVNEQADIDTLLMSCRVFGRTIETAMLAYLCDQARRRGAKRALGHINPTSKNAPAQTVYETHGFQRLTVGRNGETSWLLELDRQKIHYSKWLKIVDETAEIDASSGKSHVA